MPSIAFDGTNYLATWREGSSSLVSARIAQDGGHLDGLGIRIQTGTSPSVAFDGTNYLVAWNTTGGPPQIKASRVTQTGQALDPAWITITPLGMYDWNTDPSAVFDGTNYLLVWHYATDILGFDRVRGGASARTEWRSAPRRSRGRIHSPTVAAGATNQLAAWRDYRSGVNIYGVRIADGAVLDPSGIPIAGGQNPDTPSVAFDGTNYLVVWSNGNLYGKRVNPDGVVLNASPIPVSTASGTQAVPSVAFDGTNYVVTWRHLRSGPARTSTAPE